jgi:FkbM family methyltransferase
MIIIRKILFKILGLKYYLRILNKSFHFLYSINLLRKNNIFKYHYFDKNLIKKGYYILDIGANLGYFTILFSKWTGNSGKVFAIEPVSVFYDTIKWATKKYKNIEFFNYALGEEEKEVTLVTPDNFGYLRTGLPHIINNSDLGNKYEFTFKAEMKRGSILFENIPKLDFIKCDIEGYEEIVLPEIKTLLIKYKPILQVEIGCDHKPEVVSFLLDLGYEIFDIEDNILKPIDELKNNQSGDLLFIHKENNSILEYLKEIHCA